MRLRAAYEIIKFSVAVVMACNATIGMFKTIGLIL